MASQIARVFASQPEPNKLSIDRNAIIFPLIVRILIMCYELKLNSMTASRLSDTSHFGLDMTSKCRSINTTIIVMLIIHLDRSALIIVQQYNNYHKPY